MNDLKQFNLDGSNALASLPLIYQSLREHSKLLHSTIRMIIHAIEDVGAKGCPACSAIHGALNQHQPFPDADEEDA